MHKKYCNSTHVHVGMHGVNPRGYVYLVHSCQGDSILPTNYNVSVKLHKKMVALSPKVAIMAVFEIMQTML